MEAKSQMEIDGGGITEGEGIIPVELNGAITSPLVSSGLVSVASGST